MQTAKKTSNTPTDGESVFRYKFPIVPVCNDAATKVACAISNIVFSKYYTKEQKEQLLQIFYRLTKVSSDVAVQVSNALGARFGIKPDVP